VGISLTYMFWVEMFVCVVVLLAYMALHGDERSLLNQVGGGGWVGPGGGAACTHGAWLVPALHAEHRPTQLPTHHPATLPLQIMAIANKAPELPGHPDHKGPWFNTWLGGPSKQQTGARAPDVEAGSDCDDSASSVTAPGSAARALDVHVMATARG
jgi:hypothetical protein